MYDVVRWIVLGLLFAGLFAFWVWSKRQSRIANPPGKNANASLKVTQKRWLDQRTGVCLVEAEGQNYLLAYTVGGGVSWQPLAAVAPEKAKPAAPRFEDLLPELEAR